MNDRRRSSLSGHLLISGAAGLVLLLGFSFAPVRAGEMTLDLEKKAEFWTAHGRDDLATQTYRQLLFLNPDNRPALIGLAADALRHGHRKTADVYLGKLESLNPDDPVLPGFSREKTLGPAWFEAIARARRANALHQFGRALSNYRKAFGPYPPPPQYALDYYNDLVHTPGGYRQALDQLHTLALRYPDSLHYRLALGEILSYDPKHRWQSLDVLKPMALSPSPVSETATAAWRRVLVWEGTLPGNIPEMKAYLAVHSDPEIARQLRLAEKRALSSGPESKGAYQALKQGGYEKAVARFLRLSRKDPSNAGYWIGLSYAYLGLRQFDRARAALNRARALPLSPSQSRDRSYLSGQIAFWRLMDRGKQEETEGDFATAGSDYRKAARIFPDSPDLLVARAGLADRMHQDREAERLYRKAIGRNPADGTPWAGLLALYGREGRDRKALGTLDSLPPPLRETLEEDPDFLVTEGTLWARTGHRAEARQALDRALALGKSAPPDRQLVWAWSLYKADETAPLSTLLRRIDGQPELDEREKASLLTLHHLVALREEKALLAKKEFSTALARMKAHAGRHPADRFYREEEARILEAGGRKKEAWALVRDLGPGETVSSFEAATGVAMATGHPVTAEVWVAEAKSRWPKSVRILLLSARLQQSRGHFKKADRILRTALAHSPRDPRLLLALADNDRAMGRFGRAKKEIEMALADARLLPENGSVPLDRSLIAGQARTALQSLETEKKKRTKSHLELLAGETAFTQYTQYYYAQIGDLIPLTGLGSYAMTNGAFDSPMLHLFLMGNYFTFEYHPNPASSTFLSQTYTGLTPAVGVRFPTSFGYWEGDAGVAVAQHLQTLTPPGTVTGLFLQTDLLWNLLGGGLDLFANYTGYIDYVYFQSRYLKPTWETRSGRFRLELGPEFIVQGNSTYDAFQGGLAVRIYAEPLRSSFLVDGGILNSSAFAGLGGYEGVSWYFLY